MKGPPEMLDKNQKTKEKLLIVEDDPGLQKQLKWAYEDFEVFIAGDRNSAIELLRAEEPDVVTLDLGLPPDPDGTTEGFATMDAILSLKPDTKVIVASGHGEKSSALRAISGGAWDFYQKPVDIDELGLIVRRAFHVQKLEKENAFLATMGGEGDRVLGQVITGAPEMLKVAQMIERVANTNASVMLLGASGTGKELLAKGLHDASDRRDQAFVPINCAAIPENLLESELFGHEKGAFTGAVKTTEGKIEQANGGTLFLDEVGDIPLPLQVKLLRFIQERVIERIGGRKQIAVDTRIVCATHQNLDQMISTNEFREDLYYQMNVVQLTIPPLRDRTGDIPSLARHFLSRLAHQPGLRSFGITDEALNLLRSYNWPGNVRQLQSVLFRAAVMCDRDALTCDEFPQIASFVAESDDAHPHLTSSPEGIGITLYCEDGNLRPLDEIEADVIRLAIGHYRGRMTEVARRLGIGRSTLYRKLADLGIDNAA